MSACANVRAADPLRNTKDECLGCKTDDLGFLSWHGCHISPDRLWNPPTFLTHGCRDFRPWSLRSRDVKLTTHLHLLSTLRMTGAITLLSLYAFFASTTFTNLQLRLRPICTVAIAVKATCQY